MGPSQSHVLLNEIVDRLNVGVLVVNKDYELVLWNTYMENYSQQKAEDVVGKNLFEAFPDLPRAWLQQKIHNVFVLKNFSFTSWEHRPYLFKFFHNRPITGGVDYMRQNCTFLPIKGENSEEIEYVCITLLDVTDTSIYEGMLKNAVKSLAEASNRDGLTNIYNRRYLEQSMSKEFSRIKRYGGTLSFIIIDLDHFKSINDNYGHLAGDEILKIAAKRIGEFLRTTDILARYGGEEFAVMLPETPLTGASILAERLCQNVAKEPIIFDKKSINISASLGVAEFQPDQENHEQLISHADEALYLSKANGRNQVTIYQENSSPKSSTLNDGDTEQDNAKEILADADAETSTFTETLPEKQETNTIVNEIATSISEKLNTEGQKTATTEVTDLQSDDVAGETFSEQPEESTAMKETIALQVEHVVNDEIKNEEPEPEKTPTECEGTEEKEILEEQAMEENDLARESENDERPTEATHSKDSEHKDPTTIEIDINPVSTITSEVPVVSEPSTEEISEPEATLEKFTTSPTADSTPQEAITDETSIIELEINEEHELTAEEKADLAMIAAYGAELTSEDVKIKSKEDATVIDLPHQENYTQENKPPQTPCEAKTVYIKLGSK